MPEAIGPDPAQVDPLARLISERDATTPRRDLLEIEPLALPGGPPLSELLEALRADRS